MATAPDRTSITNERKPSEEQEDYHEAFASSSCFGKLFCFPCGYNSKSNEHKSLLHGEHKESWWIERIKRMKELSELIAGPKWKTFIRRFHVNKKHRTQFQYSPQSYALNFDQGLDEEDDDTPYASSTRLASSVQV